ncbi:hypothetical protein [Enterovirga rhinocerotis]|uniref:hypothetical protein n=1 Tax=Enterovirga rhinocerotis TaxID=1339210 RepID=UPI00105C5733|nr:hypothetical protein [Enterovirga rhinocerotis]
MTPDHVGTATVPNMAPVMTVRMMTHLSMMDVSMTDMPTMAGIGFGTGRRDGGCGLCGSDLPGHRQGDAHRSGQRQSQRHHTSHRHARFSDRIGRQAAAPGVVPASPRFGNLSMRVLANH